MYRVFSTLPFGSLMIATSIIACIISLPRGFAREFVIGAGVGIARGIVAHLVPWREPGLGFRASRSPRDWRARCCGGHAGTGARFPSPNSRRRFGGRFCSPSRLVHDSFAGSSFAPIGARVVSAAARVAGRVAGRGGHRQPNECAWSRTWTRGRGRRKEWLLL